MNKIVVAAIIFVAAFFAKTVSDKTHPDAFSAEFRFMKQPDEITCGPTCVCMVAAAYGQSVRLEDVEKWSRTRWFEYEGQDVGMTVPSYVKASLERAGVPCKVRNGGTDELFHCVAKGRFPIVLVRSGDRTWHYVVVIGFDRNSVIVADPARGERRVLALKNFLSAWRFEADLEGIPCGRVCPLCLGTGRYGWLWASCDLCGGGKRIDPLLDVLKRADIRPQTMVVPNEGAGDK